MFILLTVIKVIECLYSSINSEFLKEFEGYCNPEYKNVPAPNLKLKKVIAVFRHGDRAPLSTKNTAWTTKKCVECDESKCFTKPCVDGLLSKKGFEQAKALGRYIKDTYLSRLKVNYAKTSHTKINRTLATLKGVIEGSEIQKYSVVIEPSLVSEPQCNFLREKLLSLNSNHVLPIRNASANYKQLDNYYTSICSNVPLNCVKYSCNIEKIYDFIKTQQMNYEDISMNYRENLAANALTFSTLAANIKAKVEDKNPFYLISAHDSTLAKLLNGLKINENQIPPYASAVFIELFEDAKNKEYVRIVYQGEVKKFALYNEEFVEKSEFIKYLDMFSSKTEIMSNICKSTGTKRTDGSTAREKILKLFNSSVLSLFNVHVAESKKENHRPKEDITDSSIKPQYSSKFIN